MITNALPHYDDSVNTTGCCAKFNPAGWDDVRLHFEHKPFLRATTRAAMHIPLDMGRVFTRVLARIDAADVDDPDNHIVLSRSLSPWSDEHLFAVSAPVPGEETTTLSGDFTTKVFEGPYRDVGKWHAEMQQVSQAAGGTGEEVYFFYTTCPKCAKTYGKNYVVGVARTA
jgi:hypothetical protein